METHLFDSNFADNVAQLCYKKFTHLPKSGKPIPGKEWTLLAGIVKHVKGNLQVVSLATGSKCLGRSQMSCQGDLINDSHAEVLARRGFLKYLYHQIKEFQLTGKSQIFEGMKSDKITLSDDVTFHLFTSHVPCGDASIFPKFEETGSDEVPIKRLKTDADTACIIPDINRTGAKCLPCEVKQDKKLPGDQYHVLEVVRTKPGKGDPTLSVSCSDKILRWACVGIQGALLSIYLNPIYLSTVIVGGYPTLYSSEAMKRALFDRCKVEVNKAPILLHSNLEFPFSRRLSETNAKPSPGAIIWSNVDQKHEVCVDGRRLGSTKKNPKASLISVTKKSFLNLFKEFDPLKYSGLNYSEIKKTSVEYKKCSDDFKKSHGWTVKDENLNAFH